jgi:hypothetical protein
LDTQVLTTLITGIFSLLTALGSVWLKDYLARSHSTQKQTEEGTSLAAPPPAKWTWSRPLTVFMSAFLFGAVTRVIFPLPERGMNTAFLITLGLLGVISLGLAIDHRRSSRSMWPYQLEVLALWLAYTSGWILMHGEAWFTLIRFMSLWWLTSALIGGLIVLAFRSTPST